MTCGQVLGHLWESYIRLTKQFTAEKRKDPNHPNKQPRGMAMDALGLKDTCCRQTMLSNIELTHKLRNRYQD